MTYELIQAGLTNLITFTAIAGFAGCVMHSFYVSHQQFMAEYCPPVALLESILPIDNSNSKSKYLQVEKKTKAIAPITPITQQAEEDIWEAPIATSSPRYWVRSTQPQQPTLYLLPPAKEEIKPATKKTRKTPAKSKTPAASKRKKAA